VRKLYITYSTQGWETMLCLVPHGVDVSDWHPSDIVAEYSSEVVESGVDDFYDYDLIEVVE
jgi:hypothetical protein